MVVGLRMGCWAWAWMEMGSRMGMGMESTEAKLRKWELANRAWGVDSENHGVYFHW